MILKVISTGTSRLSAKEAVILLFLVQRPVYSIFKIKDYSYFDLSLLAQIS